jgi:hypothetical protein
MNRTLRRTASCWTALIMSLCGVGQASESVDVLNKTLSDVSTIQMELAIAQKRFSVMSREMAERERCAARELLGASIDFREVTEEARMIGRMVGEMKSPEDTITARRFLGLAARRVVSLSENDIEIVDEFLATITTPEAIEMAKTVRSKMVELRDIFQLFASKQL